MTDRIALMKKFSRPSFDKVAWQVEVGKRLRGEIRRYLGKKSERDFARKIGIAQGCLSQILNGNASPSALTLYNIQTKTPIDIIWVLTGEKDD